MINIWNNTLIYQIHTEVKLKIRKMKKLKEGNKVSKSIL